MKLAAVALCVALAACSPPPEDEATVSADDPTMAKVDVTRQTLNGVGVRVRLITNWNRDWDTAIKYYNPDVGHWTGGFTPASSYETPTFNAYLSEGAGQPALFSAAEAPYSVAASIQQCGHLSGITQEISMWPWMDNLTPGHTVYVWFMPRCRSGSWPTSGPPESFWRFSFVVPTAPGNYIKDFFMSGFYGNKTMWRQWFSGCRDYMDYHWSSDTTLGLYQCRSIPQGCLCDDGKNGHPYNEILTTWW